MGKPLYLLLKIMLNGSAPVNQKSYG